MRSILLALALFGANSAAASPLDDIQGKWTTGLMSDPSGYFQYRQIYEFTGTHCQMKIDILTSIPMGQSGERQRWDCDFVVRGPSATVPDAWEVDIDMNHFWRTPLHPSTLADWNEKKYCGFDDWQMGVAKDVIGLDCDGDVNARETWFDLVKIIPETSIQFGLTSDDPTDHSRPTALDPDNIVPRNGMGGPIALPSDGPDLIKGYYQVTSYQKTTDCDDTSRHASTPPFTHFEVMANKDIIPLVVGWTLKTCNSVADCQAKPSEIEFGGDFAIHDKASDELFRGTSRAWNWTGRCNVQAAQTLTERAANGALHLVTKQVSGAIDGITTMEACDGDNPLVDAQIPLLHCDARLEMSSTRL